VRFSERMGINRPKVTVQIDAMDNDLRIGLWNALLEVFWDNLSSNDHVSYHPHVYALVKSIWRDFYKESLDAVPGRWYETKEHILGKFQSGNWWWVYEFIEFVSEAYVDQGIAQDFRDRCNVVMARELSGYRFVGGQIAQLTSDDEVEAIESSLTNTDPIKPVSQHLRAALALYSDKQSPDYRNSIKESISAVEALCGLIAGKPKATLGDALGAISRQQSIDMHQSLRQAFDKLYGYTSDAQGIRHALTEEPNLGQEDAQYMLVACSAFINYLLVKANKAGLQLGTPTS
jgi:hypothetical protein